MPTPAQLRIIHLIALSGGIATPAQITFLTRGCPKYLNRVLCQMQHAGFVNRGKGIVWLTMRGMDENDIPATGNDSPVA